MVQQEHIEEALQEVNKRAVAAYCWVQSPKITNLPQLEHGEGHLLQSTNMEIEAEDFMYQTQCHIKGKAVIEDWILNT